MRTGQKSTKEHTNLLPLKHAQEDEEDRKGKKIKVEDSDDEESSASEEEQSSQDSESSDHDSQGYVRPPRVRGNLPAYLFSDSAWGGRKSKKPIYVFKKTRLFKIEMGCSRHHNSRMLTGLKRYIQEKLATKARVPQPFAFQFQKRKREWAGDDEFVILREEIFDWESTFIELMKPSRIGVFPLNQSLVLPESSFPRTVPVKLLSAWNCLEFTLENTVQIEAANITYPEFEAAVNSLCESLLVEDGNTEVKYRRQDGVERKYLPIPTTASEFFYLLGEVLLFRTDNFDPASVEHWASNCWDEQQGKYTMTLRNMFAHLRRQGVISSVPAPFRRSSRKKS